MSWSGALLDFDSAEAHAAIDRVFAARTLDGALRDVVLPVLREVGEGWERGEVTVAQEHYATELLAGRLRGLAREWDDGLGPRAVLACPPGERHDIGLLCCGLALHRRGWRVTYLGPDTPVEALAGTVGTVSPALVVIGVLQPGPLHDAAPELAVLAGGGGGRGRRRRRHMGPRGRRRRAPPRHRSGHRGRRAQPRPGVAARAGERQLRH